MHFPPTMGPRWGFCGLWWRGWRKYALILFVVLCPLAVLPSLDTIDADQGLDKTWPCLIANFLACSGFVALNEIAVELQDPFGEDANDYPLTQEQRNLVWAIEECFLASRPTDFSVKLLGARPRRPRC
mmetsp:Transcript_11839/g.38019  ORF Transcript_11839/g.38019 Transcript_11839/m.38019 type:complete len:128 (+) Transcript_11839:32-415(+)